MEPRDDGPGPSRVAVRGAYGRGGIAILKVLLAEDELFQREAFAAIFEAANKRLMCQRIQFELTQVASATAVLELLAETTDWQLVLLDVVMPDVCGTEIIQDVRATLGDTVPVLMISSERHMGLVQNCLKAGADMCATPHPSSDPSHLARD